MSLRSGDVLGGKYEVERVLGEGGMGVIVSAKHRELGNRVAIKCLHASALGDERAIARFEREARAAAALTSEHIARVIDVARLEGGSPCIVMELLEGEDLHALLVREGALSVADTIRYASDAAEGLAEAHAAGIVHRDVKPSNLFVARRKKGRPIVKVLDFGIAKNLADSSDRSLTATQALVGSPQYMSPEQVREAKTLDARTDVWALGVTMYECLTGRKPFDAASIVDLCFAIVHAPPTSLRTHRPDLPPKLEAVITKCLAKDPQDRYATMVELQDELLLILSHVSSDSSGVDMRLARARFEATSERSPDAFAATAASHEVVVTKTGTTARDVPRSPKRSLFAAVGVTLAILGGLVLGLRPRDPSREPPPESLLPSAPIATAPAASSPAGQPVEARAAAGGPSTAGALAPAPSNETAPEPSPPDGGMPPPAVAGRPAGVPGKGARKPTAPPREDPNPARSKGLQMTIE